MPSSAPTISCKRPSPEPREWGGVAAASTSVRAPLSAEVGAGGWCRSRASWLTLALAVAACHTDTSGLERRQAEPPGTDAGIGGSSGTTGSTSPPPLAGALDSGASGPASPGSIAIVNGVVDGGRLFACARDAATRQSLAAGQPTPADGLAFGGVYHLPLDWDLASRAVELELFVSIAALDAGATCDDLHRVAQLASNPPDAGPGTPEAGAPEPGPADSTSGPRGPRSVGSLTLAAGSLFTGKHYALAATGCAAPEALSAPESCGPPDPLLGSRASLLLVEFGAERIVGGSYFGLQFLNASRVLGSADLALQPEGAASGSVSLARGVGFGALRPRAVATVEQPLAVELSGDGTGTLAYSQSWTQTLEASSLGEIEPGRNYLLASIGPTQGPDGASAAFPLLVLVSAQ